MIKTRTTVVKQDHRVGGSIPGCRSLHAEVSLGKTLNPQIAPDGQVC